MFIIVCSQVRSILRNETGVETWIKDKVRPSFDIQNFGSFCLVCVWNCRYKKSLKKYYYICAHSTVDIYKINKGNSSQKLSLQIMCISDCTCFMQTRIEPHWMPASIYHGHSKEALSVCSSFLRQTTGDGMTMRTTKSLCIPITWGWGPTGAWCVTSDGGHSLTGSGGLSERVVISTPSL